MTTLAELITNGTTVAGNTGLARPCRLGAILDNLDRPDRDAVHDALNRPGYADAQLAAVLTRGGHPIGTTTVQRHRLGRCHCPTSKETPA